MPSTLFPVSETLSEPMTAPSVGGAAVLDREVVQQPVEPGDHERFSHYVDKSKIVDASVFGTPVQALCGKKWVPSRDPKRFPVCPACKEIFEQLRSGKGDQGDGSGSDAGSGTGGAGANGS